jgi:putative NADPH-quinone reductase
VRIAILQGHPDPDGARFLRVLADAYAAGAKGAGHEVRVLDIARLDFPLLSGKEEYETGAPPPAIARAQKTIVWAEHLVLFFPLWLGTMPALVKGFLEQTLRPGFAMDKTTRTWRPLLKGRSARLVVTMGMPEPVYRWYYLAHGLKGLERNVLRFVGIAPVRETWIGGVDGLGAAGRGKWLAKLGKLGAAGK